MRRLFRDCKKKISVDYITITNYDLSTNQQQQRQDLEFQKHLSVLHNICGEDYRYCYQ